HQAVLGATPASPSEPDMRKKAAECPITRREQIQQTASYSISSSARTSKCRRHVEADRPCCFEIEDASSIIIPGKNSWRVLRKWAPNLSVVTLHDLSWLFFTRVTIIFTIAGTKEVTRGFADGFMPVALSHSERPRKCPPKLKSVQKGGMPWVADLVR